MDIVIVGAGKMGQELCRSLADEGHNITLIEKMRKYCNYY